MKFKVGDEVSFVNAPNHTGTIRGFHPRFDNWVDVMCDKCGRPSFDELTNLILKESQKMQNKNEWKIGCHTLSKTKCGSLIVTDQLGDKHLYRINRNEFGALKDFLSTPYQEEEVYVTRGSVVRFAAGTYFTVTEIEGQFILVQDSLKISFGRFATPEADGTFPYKCKLKDLLNNPNELAEWEVIK